MSRFASVLLAAVLLPWLLAGDARSLPPRARIEVFDGVAPPGLQPGDLVFREGRDAISHAVLAVDGGGYSHVGMLLGDARRWHVIHAVPSESPGSADGVVVDTLDAFLAPARARRFAFYRVTGASAPQRALAGESAMARLGAGFGLKPDATRTYCTHLVDAAWAAAGWPLQAHPQRVRLPLLDIDELLLPSALRKSPRLQHAARGAQPDQQRAP